MAKRQSANDMRSTVKNPTSKAYAADRANRAALGHANVPKAGPAKPPPPATGPAKR